MAKFSPLPSLRLVLFGFCWMEISTSSSAFFTSNTYWKQTEEDEEDRSIGHEWGQTHLWILLQNPRSLDACIRALHPLQVCHKSFHRGLLHKDLTVKLIQSREHKITVLHPWWRMLLWNGPSFMCSLDEGLKRACPMLLRILVQNGTEEIVSRGKPYSRAFSESPEKLEGNGPIDYICPSTFNSARVWGNKI